MAKRGRRPHGDDDEARARRLASHVRETRERRQLSQQGLSSRAGVAISTLQKIERAQTKDPGFFTVVRLARVLDLVLEDLTGEEA